MTLEKVSHRIEIINETHSHGIIRFRYNDTVGNWFDFFISAKRKINCFRRKGWKVVEDIENE
jgi:hypothetical protein